MPIRQSTRVQRTLLEFRIWFGIGASVVFFALALLESWSAGGGRAGSDPLVLLELIIAVLCGADVWWLRVHRRASPWGAVVPALAMSAALVTTWINGAGNLIYIAVCTAILFIFLSARVAFGLSLTALVAAFGILFWRWESDAWVLIRVILANGSVLGICVLSRAAFDRLIGGYRETLLLLEESLEASEHGIGVIGPTGQLHVYNETAARMFDAPPALDAAFRAGREVNIRELVALQMDRGELPVVAESSPEAARAIEFGANIFDPSFPERFVRRTMNGRWVEVVTRRMASGNLVRSYLDVTAYQNAQRAAEAAVVARTAFLSHVSHQFRTPLNALLGLSHLALESDLSGRQRAWLEQMQVAGQALLHLVDDVIDLSAVESGASEMQRADVAVNALVTTIREELGARCAARGIPFTIAVAPEVPAVFTGDADRIRRVLGMLVARVNQADVPGPLELQITREDDAAQGARLRFVVRHTTPARVPARLAESTIGDAQPLAADGLAVVERYVALMGGRLADDLVDGTATATSFDVPLAEARTPASVAPRPSVPPAGLEPPPVPTTPRVEARAADAPPVGSARTRVAQLLGAVQERVAAVAELPYRGWVIGTLTIAIGMAVMSVGGLVAAGWAPLQQELRRQLAPAAFAAAAFLVIGWRHRRFDRPTSREPLVVGLAGFVFFALALYYNGAVASVFLPPCIVYVYLAMPIGQARRFALLFIGAVVLRFATAPGEYVLFLRTVSAGLIVAVLIEALVRALRLSRATLDEVTVVLHDTATDLLADNATLEQSRAAAEAASAQRTELMAVVSHEIRTPMNAILGLSHLALRGDLTGRQRDLLERIQRHGVYLSDLVNNILDVTRLEAGKLSLRVTTFGVEDVVRSVTEVLTRDAEAKGLRSSIEVAPDVPRWLRGDEVRLTQILHNLVSNAVKFTAQGRVSVRIRRVPEPRPGVWLRLEVQDTGFGLTVSEQERLFRQFERVGTGAARVAGSGLGLVIVKGIVEQMGGSIGVRSEPGVGSTFWCIVRLEEAIGAPSDTARDGRRLRRALRGVRGARVLVVDDNRINREIAVEMLCGVGLDAVAVEDGRVAAERALAESFDLVLLDLQMPGLDGIAVTERIRREKGADVLPVVAMTASVMAVDRARCLAAGMNAHLSKPLEPEALWEVLLRWIAPRMAVDPSAAEPETGPSVTFEALAAFPQIRGLEVALGLRRVLGNQTLYRALLGEFVRSQGDVVARLQQALQAENRPMVERLAHALAGVAGGIGAHEVQEVAAELEREVRWGREHAELVAAVERVRLRIEPLLADLERSVGVTDRAAVVLGGGPGPSDVDVQRELDALEALLRASDPEARDWLAGHGALLETLGPEAAVAIRTAVERYDLSDAETRLRAVRSG